ncbi:right-handed parallel beta-helix repeat-containing protein [Belliella pelovolcani]|uniref:Right handed beta helix region n=1 Tax=Belliella pelovolcani TaxID=529505 RepID=A0A1N7LIT1_9BACT|nr:right-handed parallel beta-helix repeat-containing protein [Belliella pelovolcani]SIS73661.1 hypothetical protein SAMN05421761_103364 [Belliella pelovolcani]
MKTLKSLLLLAMLAMALFACKEDEEINPIDENPDEILDGISGDMTEIDFERGETYKVVGDLVVPQNASVTIPAGVTLEFQEGPNGEAWFIDVFGSLYIKGEEGARVTLTASQELIEGPKNNGIGQLWGGVIGTNVAGDLVILYTDILYAGGAAREENAMAQPATGGGGELNAGDASYALYYIRQAQMRQDGIFVLNNSKIAFCPDDAIRINGGKTLMTYNTFEVTGGTGGDAVNIKAATSGDFAFNLFYNLATNGLKSADTGPGERGRCHTNFYNNTILNSGYRRAEPGRGAGLNYESDSYGDVHNNLLVNNRFGLRLVSGESQPRVESINYGYNWNYGAVQTITDEFYPTSATSSVGLIGNDPRTPIPSTDVAGAPQENDPMFENYDPSTFTFGGNSSVSTDPLSRNISPIPAGADFHLKADSPALTGGITDFDPVHTAYTTLDGSMTFTPPAPRAFFGAFGTRN